MRKFLIFLLQGTHFNGVHFHRGKYNEEDPVTPNRPYLEVAIDFLILGLRFAISFTFPLSLSPPTTPPDEKEPDDEQPE